MNNILKRFVYIVGALACLLLPTVSIASLDLLAGVESGINKSTTTMSLDDLKQTQKILTTQILGKHPAWVNKKNKTSYEIIIKKRFFYGHYPCLLYRLNVVQNIYRGDFLQTHNYILKTCRNPSGKWVAIERLN